MQPLGQTPTSKYQLGPTATSWDMQQGLLMEWRKNLLCNLESRPESDPCLSIHQWCCWKLSHWPMRGEGACVHVTNLWSSGWGQRPAETAARTNQQLLFVELHLKLEMRFVQELWGRAGKMRDNRKYWAASGEPGPKVVFFLTVFRLIGQFQFN